MTAGPPGDLRESLHRLADAAEPADLYERAMHRSRRIARREAAVGGTAALVALAALTSGLWWLPSRATNAPPAAGARPALAPAPIHPDFLSSIHPSAYASPSHPIRTNASPRHTETRPPVPVTTTTSPPSRSLADLAGSVFYQQSGTNPDIVRLSPDDRNVETVLSDAPSPVGVSPDGDKIAYTENGALLVRRTGSDEAEQVADGVTTTDRAPVWSPGGDQLLVDLATPAVVDIGSGAVTPLPDDLGTGADLQWAADGSPVQTVTHPPAPDDVLPVTGTVIGQVPTPDGGLLVRTVSKAGTRLFLIAADNTLLVEAAEPPGLSDLNLLAYTR